MGVMNSCLEMLGGGEGIPNIGKTDTFALMVSELAGYYINLQIIQKFTNIKVQAFSTIFDIFKIFPKMAEPVSKIQREI